MIIIASLFVAFLPPPADVAMADRLGIGFGTSLHCTLQRHLHNAVVRSKSSQPKRLWVEVNVRSNYMKEFRLQALQLREEVLVEA
jgi:hypothetical protein